MKRPRLFKFLLTTLAAGSLASLLTSCAIGPDFKRPAVSGPERFRGAPETASTNSLADLPWWSVFNDPALQEIVRVALTNNYNLRMAVSRVEQASQLRRQANSVFLPQVGYYGDAQRSRLMLADSPTPYLQDNTTADTYFGGVGALWEIDLWGRLRRQSEAARANYFANQDAARGARLSVICGVARAYFELQELDEQRRIAQRTVETFQRTLKLFTDQHDEGLISQLELARARAALRSVSASIPELERQIAVKENELQVLAGQNPGPVARAESFEATRLPEIPAGLPSQLLERRPDILAAEQQMRAANAKIGMALGDFFPKIGLTAVFGGVSSDLSGIATGGAGAWSLAATTAGPLFQGGRLKAQYKQSKAAFEEAKLHYQATTLTAFREVADALVSRQKLEAARVEQAEAVVAYRQAVELANDRYREGKASYYEVLEAQQQLYPAENALAQIQTSQRLVVIQFYKALGGGWNVDSTNNPASTR
jgi:multidrug efflux system outer membrane protein